MIRRTVGRGRGEGERELRLAVLGGKARHSADDVRRLPLGDIDPTPETEPARPDPDEDVIKRSHLRGHDSPETG